VVPSEACEDVHVGDPFVELGTGRLEFEPIVDDEIGIVFGPGNGGCGYHLDLVLRTEQLCPVVWARIDLFLLGIDGGAIGSQNRHVQMVRDEADSTLQYHPFRAFIPVEHFPNDPEHEDVCPAESGSGGPCDEYQFLVSVEVEDHGGRIATTERVLDPWCCR